MMKGKPRLLSILALSLAFSFATFLSAKAQISYGGKPASFDTAESVVLKKNNSKQNSFSTRFVKRTFNPEDLMALNQWSEGELATKPLIIGGLIHTNIDFAKEATRTELPSGQVIYRLKVATDNEARAINLYYKDFFIPKNGGSLFLYTPDKSNILGAYTYETHPSHGAFATEIIPGSEIILEYVLPIGETALPSIIIDGVHYIFNRKIAQGYNRALNPIAQKRIPVGEAEDNVENPYCSINSNCPEGDKWHAEKASVAQMVLITDEYGGYCTGSLVNNTNEDYKPLILTAAHCIGSKSTWPKGVQFDKFMFSFHYQKSGCSDGSFAGGEKIKTMVGCKPLAFSSLDKRSDGLLLELSQEIPVDYNVYYAGWDRSADMPQDLFGLHHPSGDAMKLSYFDHTKNLYGGIAPTTWKSEKEQGGENCHFGFRFTDGDTYGGSSGSPLWNQNHYIVGTLSGGTDGNGVCNASFNLYGRLNCHWDKYANDPDYTECGGVKTAMKTFLDPKDGGTAIRLKGRWRDNARTIEPIKEVNIKVDHKSKMITLEWQDIARKSYPEHWTLSYLVYRNGIQIPGIEIAKGTNTFTESFDKALENPQVEGAVSYAIVAKYTSTEGKTYLSDKVSNGIVLTKLIDHLTPNIKEQKNGVRLSWAPAGNMMELSNFGYPEKEGEKKLSTTTFGIKGIKLPIGGGQYFTPSNIAIGSSFYVEDLVDPQINAKKTKRVADRRFYVNSVKVIPAEEYKGGTELRIILTSARKQKSVSKYFTIPADWKPGDWIEVFLDQPFSFDPLYSLFVGLSVPNEIGANKLKTVLVNGTSDDALPVRGIVLVTDDKMNPNVLSHLPYVYVGNFSDKLAGYPAIRPMISMSNRSLNTDPARGDVTGVVVARAKKAVPLPKVLGYRVFCNGERITKVIDNRDYTELLYMTHRGGKVTNKYTVEVVYDNEANLNDATLVENHQVSSLYPTSIGEDGIVYLTNSEAVKSMYIYQLDGTLVKQIENPSSSVSLASLPKGIYFVVLSSENGKTTHRIIR